MPRRTWSMVVEEPQAFKALRRCDTDCSVQVAGQSLAENLLLDGLGQVLIAAGRQAAGDGPSQGIERSTPGWEPGGAAGFRLPCANRGEAGIEAIHHRHLHIHEHDIGIAGLYLFDAGLAVIGDVDLEPAIREVSLNQQDVEFVVVHNQEKCAQPTEEGT